jgi:hypothetical protein
MRPLKDWGHYVGDTGQRDGEVGRWGVSSADCGIRSAEYKTQDMESLSKEIKEKDGEMGRKGLVRR